MGLRCKQAGTPLEPGDGHVPALGLCEGTRGSPGRVSAPGCPFWDRRVKEQTGPPPLCNTAQRGVEAVF